MPILLELKYCIYKHIAHALALIALVFVAGANAQELVDPRSGRLFSSATDLSLNAGPVTIEIRRVLQPGADVSGLLGSRWSLNWERRLERIGPLVILERHGSQMSFLQEGDTSQYKNAIGGRISFDAQQQALYVGTDGVDEIYDKEGRLTRLDYRNGNIVTLHYDQEGQLNHISGPKGSRIDLVTDSAGRVTSIQTSDGDAVEYSYEYERLVSVRVNKSHPIRYDYDAGGRLIKATRPLTGVSEFAYESEGRVHKWRRADGSADRYVYDDESNRVRWIDATGAVTTFTRSPDGTREEITDSHGNKTTLTYGEEGLLRTVTGPAGGTMRFEYDTLGRMTSVQDAVGRSTELEYLKDTILPEAILFPGGNRERFSYDSKLNLTQIKGISGTFTAFDYAPDGNLVSLRGLAEAEKRLGYDDKGRLQSVSDASGAMTRFEYDHRGNLSRMIDALGGVTAWGYDDQRNLINTTDPEGNVTRYEYSPMGLLTSIVDPMNGATRFKHNSVGRLVEDIDPAGVATRYEYDSAGRLVKVLYPGGASRSYRYDALGNLVAVSRDGKALVEYGYDVVGNIVKTRFNSGLEIDYGYDAAGNLASWKDNAGGSEAFSYDRNGLLTSTRDANGEIYQYRHDRFENVIAVTDPLGRVTASLYSPRGKLTEVTEPNGEKTRLQYDAVGRLKKVRLPGGGETRYDYDAVDNLLGITNLLGDKIKFEYDKAGRLARSIDAKGQSTTFKYDKTGRVVQKRLASGKTIDYRYDIAGRLLEVDDGEYPIRYRYDLEGNVVRVDYPAIERSLQYRYDAEGSITEFTDSEGGKVRYEYDDADRLVGLELPNGKRFTIKYDGSDRITRVIYPNGVEGQWRYDAIGQTKDIMYRTKEDTTLTCWRYDYDSAGNLTEMVTYKGESTAYEYDKNDRLTAEIPAGGPRSSYAYQSSGNRNSLTRGKSRIKYHYDKVDRLLKADKEKFRHDANGNLSERTGPTGSTRYHYDTENHLVKVELPGGRTVRFGYAPTGQRIWREDAYGRTWFVSDGTHVVAELDSTLSTKTRYIYGPGTDYPLVMVQGKQHYYYLSDALGSVAGLVNAEGQLLTSYRMDAFGNLLEQRDPLPNTLLFTGREYEPELGLYYYRARYYDPALGRFLSPDPYQADAADPASMNPYVYVKNAPTRYRDPMGLTGTTGGDSRFLRRDFATLQEYETFLARVSRPAQNTPLGPKAFKLPPERYQRLVNLQQQSRPGVSRVGVQHQVENMLMRAQMGPSAQQGPAGLERAVRTEMARDAADPNRWLRSDPHYKPPDPPVRPVGRGGRGPGGTRMAHGQVGNTNPTVVKGAGSPGRPTYALPGPGRFKRAQQFVKTHPKTVLTSVTVTLTVAHLIACRSEGLSVGQCAAQLAAGVAIASGTAVIAAVVGPTGAVIMTVAMSAYGTYMSLASVYRAGSEIYDWRKATQELENALLNNKMLQKRLVEYVPQIAQSIGTEIDGLAGMAKEIAEAQKRIEKIRQEAGNSIKEIRDARNKLDGNFRDLQNVAKDCSIGSAESRRKAAESARSDLSGLESFTDIIINETVKITQSVQPAQNDMQVIEFLTQQMREHKRTIRARLIWILRNLSEYPEDKKEVLKLESRLQEATRIASVPVDKHIERTVQYADEAIGIRDQALKAFNKSRALVEVCDEGEEKQPADLQKALSQARKLYQEAQAANDAVIASETILSNAVNGIVTIHSVLNKAKTDLISARQGVEGLIESCQSAMEQAKKMATEIKQVAELSRKDGEMIKQHLGVLDQKRNQACSQLIAAPMAPSKEACDDMASDARNKAAAAAIEAKNVQTLVSTMKARYTSLLNQQGGAEWDRIQRQVLSKGATIQAIMDRVAAIESGTDEQSVTRQLNLAVTSEARIQTQIGTVNIKIGQIRPLLVPYHDNEQVATLLNDVDKLQRAMEQRQSSGRAKQDLQKSLSLAKQTPPLRESVASLKAFLTQAQEKLGQCKGQASDLDINEVRSFADAAEIMVPKANSIVRDTQSCARKTKSICSVMCEGDKFDLRCEPGAGFTPDSQQIQKALKKKDEFEEAAPERIAKKTTNRRQGEARTDMGDVEAEVPNEDKVYREPEPPIRDTIAEKFGTPRLPRVKPSTGPKEPGPTIPPKIGEPEKKVTPTEPEPKKPLESVLLANKQHFGGPAVSPFKWDNYIVGLGESRFSCQALYLRQADLRLEFDFTASKVSGKLTGSADRGGATRLDEKIIEDCQVQFSGSLSNGWIEKDQAGRNWLFGGTISLTLNVKGTWQFGESKQQHSIQAKLSGTTSTTKAAVKINWDSMSRDPTMSGVPVIRHFSLYSKGHESAYIGNKWQIVPRKLTIPVNFSETQSK